MTEFKVPRIFRLSDQVVSGIRSSKHISSLQGVVLALLENSLDARSGKVDITVDWLRGGCTVQDDGHGISASEFEPEGGLGRIYCTSKLLPDGGSMDAEVDTHGSYGMFLAELSSLSMLSITSRTPDHDCSASITIHNGSVIKRQISESQTDYEMDFATGARPGTQITIRDLFGNLPVRVKQRTMAGPEEQKLWHEVKHGIVSLLLAWPYRCSVKLRDVNSDSRIVTLTNRSSSGCAELTSRNLRHLDDGLQKFDLRDVLSLLFQSGFAMPESRSQWIPLAASTSLISLKGLISVQPTSTKQCQFISIGIHPCHRRSTAFSELYEAANRTFHRSDFGKVGNVQSEHVGKPSSRPDDGTGRYVARQRRPLKGVDHFASFFVQIQLRSKQNDHLGSVETLDEALLAAISQVLEAAMYGWLEKNYFRPMQINKSRNENRRPPSKYSNATSASTVRPTAHSNAGSKRPFDSNETSPVPDGYDDGTRRHSRIRVGSSNTHSHLTHTSFTPGMTAIIETQDVTDSVSGVREGLGFAHQSLKAETNASAHSSDEYGCIDHDEFIAAAATAEATMKVASRLDPDEQSFEWTDPVSNCVYMVDSRTGTVTALEPQTSLSHATSCSSNRHISGAVNPALSSMGRPLRLVERTALSQKKTNDDMPSSKLIPELLQKWDNPIFQAQAEEPIPTIASAESTTIETNSLDQRIESTFSSRLDYRITGNLATRLSRAALENFEVVNQVDKKFIMCKVTSTTTLPSDEDSGKEITTVGEQVLVLVDQHAASERTLVEGLLNDFHKSLQTTPDVHRQPLKTLRSNVMSSKTIQFDIPEDESVLFASYRDHFAVWGVRYEIIRVNDVADQDEYMGSIYKEHRLRVISLPPVIAERCSNFPRLCIDMMRAEVWALADGTKKPISSMATIQGQGQTYSHENTRSEPAWLKCISACPQGILDMINSRACRSAVMFNDELTMDQCRSLMSDLSACTFPFVCAHGRTSMVPLAQLSRAATALSPATPTDVLQLNPQSEEIPENLGSALNNWMLSKSHTTHHQPAQTSKGQVDSPIPAKDLEQHGRLSPEM